MTDDSGTPRMESPDRLSDRGENLRILVPFSVLTTVAHLCFAATAEFGIFRDELYYIACANHPDIGYVDHPPLSIWLLAAWKSLFGDSLFSIRALPALCSGVTTFIVGRISLELGGGRYALVMTSVSVLLAPIYLAFFSIFNMNAFDLLLWAGVFLAVLKILRTREPSSWYLPGLLIGLGALNKISMLWLGVGVFAGFVLTDRRAVLGTKAPWIAGILAVLVFLPYIVWNFTHGFADLEFIRNASAEKYSSQNPLTFLQGIVLILNPTAAPVWVAGFWFLLARREYRPVGVSVITVLVILLANFHTKPEYFAAATTVLLPAGSVQIERLLRGTAGRRLRIPYLVLVTASGIGLIPMTIDVLPVESFIRYQAVLGQTPESNEGLELVELPQFYADRFGWREMAETVAGVYASLPDSDKARCLIYGRNYGEAAAVDYFGREYGLPPAISRHNSYWFWSMDHIRDDVVMIVIGLDREELLETFWEVGNVAVIRSPYAMPYENNLTVMICRKVRGSLMERWMREHVFI